MNASRVGTPCDYQNIIINFRGDGIALPSDQGLHIVDQSSTNYTLVSAVGDMHNAMSLSAIISPSKDGKSRNIIANMCGNFDIILDHLARIPQLVTTLYTPCNMFYLVRRPIGC